MPYLFGEGVADGTRSPGQGSHAPICQQCHEDVRDVGDSLAGQIAADEVFDVSSPDGSDASGNPRFQVFPHESSTQSLLVEAGDDLCTNCHTVGTTGQLLDD